MVQESIGCRCPPGHGDIYPSLLGSHFLDALLKEGIKYLFVSNSDNLGATLDLDLLAYFAGSGKSFLMEVCSRALDVQVSARCRLLLHLPTLAACVASYCIMGWSSGKSFLMEVRLLGRSLCAKCCLQFLMPCSLCDVCDL